jgi:hypothetical protein
MMSINMTHQTSSQKPAMQANYMNPQEPKPILSARPRCRPGASATDRFSPKEMEEPDALIRKLGAR